MLQYSIFICIPSDLVLLAQAHQLPNADLFLPNKTLPVPQYNFPLNVFLLRQEGLHVHRRHLLSEKSLYTHYIYTLHHSTNIHLLPNGQLLPLQVRPRPKPFLWASELLWAQQSVLM